jgi:hypothetical protein
MTRVPKVLVPVQWFYSFFLEKGWLGGVAIARNTEKSVSYSPGTEDNGRGGEQKGGEQKAPGKLRGSPGASNPEEQQFGVTTSDDAGVHNSSAAEALLLQT